MNLFCDLKKKKSDNAQDYRYILSKIASQNNN